MTYTYRFEWPAASNINSVHITGTFDNWSKTNNPLKRNGDSFVGTVTVPKKEKLVFKFVINEESWVISPDYKIEADASGIENNYVDEAELEEVIYPTPTTSEPVPAAESSKYTLPQETGKVAPASVTAPATAPAASPKVSNTSASKELPATKVVAAEKHAPVTTTTAPAVSDKPEPAQAPKAETPKVTAPAITQAPPPTTTAKKNPVPASVPTPLEEESTGEQIYSPSPEPADSVALPLTQVLTTSSSFAAVSLPSQDSVFEHLDETEIEDDEEEEEEEDEDIELNQFNTPTNSLFNSGVLPSPNTTKADSPLRSKNNNKNNVEILQAPGAFPASSPSPQINQVPSGPEKEGRRDGLVSRFKSLFRY